MILFPAIDIRNGKCVRLTQGDYDKENIYHDSPVTIAKRWQQEGASYLHIVDLDAAKTGKVTNKEIIQAIARETSLPIQIGGGIRSIPTIEDYLAIGVNRVIIGTAAIHDQPFLQQAINQFGEHIIVSLDCRNGYIATDGWQKTSGLKALTFIKSLEQQGVKTIVYTDVLKDGMLMGPNFKELAAINQATSIQVIASGGVTTTGDIEKLKAQHLYGAIVGKALYDGRVSLKTLMEGM